MNDKNRHLPLLSSGFALVATISVMVLLVMIALAMLSLSTIEIRQSRQANHQVIAKANARMALMIALGELQKYAGPDTRVTARAEILESAGSHIANPNWLGVWRTTYAANGINWPLIGKKSSPPAPYKYRNIYSDLRNTNPSLSQERWKKSLLATWLVSRTGKFITPKTQLSLSNGQVVELVGKGTLNDNITQAYYKKNKVLVEKVPVKNKKGITTGAYAWYISGNNQKASIALNPYLAKDPALSFSASQTDNPSTIKDASGNTSFSNYFKEAKPHFSKIISDKSAALVSANISSNLARAIGFHFHDLTTHSSGLFTNTALGGLKKDLYPLLFGAPQKNTLIFPSPSPNIFPHNFSSDYPIIPGKLHAVLGPSFNALRSWGRLKYKTGLQQKSIMAETSPTDNSMRYRNPKQWPDHWNFPWGSPPLPGKISDGYTFKGDKWASDYPKIFPVMTDCRWHYYFSYTKDTPNQTIRTHLIPRVCMWNPYNVTIKTPSLVVLMPNPFYLYNNYFHFFFSSYEIRRIKHLFPNNEAIQKWTGIIQFRGSKDPYSGEEGLFPDSRYLGFVLEPTEFAPGKCLVFSPKITHPDHTSQGIKIQRYNKNNIAANILSATVPQGEDHFFHNYQTQNVWFKYPENGGGSWNKRNSQIFKSLDLSQVYKYEPWCMFFDNFPFVLKAANESPNLSCKDIVSSSIRAKKFPTLQLINNGNGGTSSYAFWYYEWWWGNSASASNNTFGYLSSFNNTPRKNAPALHQWGAKLLWLDESNTESNNPPMRIGFWDNTHFAFNPVPIAEWNIRSNLATRSPISPCGAEWYVNTLGGWILQFAPHSPQDSNDKPNFDGKYFSKSPLGEALQFSLIPTAIFFDLPNPIYGGLSLGTLRHAQLSPYSWHPSYIIGNSLANLQAPLDASAHYLYQSPYSGFETSRWDEMIGGSNPYHFQHGPRTFTVHSSDLLQIGQSNIYKKVESSSLSSKEEILAYDIAYEVNQNLWDQFFISGLPLNSSGSAFQWDHVTTLWNKRYSINPLAKINLSDIKTKWESTNNNEGLTFGFWNNAYILKNKGAFNVNSTSVEAWVGFLSGLMGVQRFTQENGLVGNKDESIFSRLQKPYNAVTTAQTGVDKKGGWVGGRKLTQNEIRTLAIEIVKEVKRRGPFISLADFVNRRLISKSGSSTNPSSLRGTLEEAIKNAHLNNQFNTAPYLSTTHNEKDNNMPEWKVDLNKQPKSKAWGLPGYLTQGDLLEPLAPAMTTRDDSFIIRAYGESRDANGKIMATAYLEAVIERSPDYVAAQNLDDSQHNSERNKPNAQNMFIQYATGVLKKGSLSPTNKKYGRKMIIQSFRWLNKKEI